MTPDETIAAIRQLYYSATKVTIARDLARAIDLLRRLPSEDDRERAAVYMDGLAQMRSEWGVSRPASNASRPTTPPGPPRPRRRPR